MGKFEIYSAEDAIKIERDKRWPLVYLLKNDKKIYIGETTNVVKRLINHSMSEEKVDLNDKYIIKHNQSNKSISYLLESDLINRAFADKSYELVNTKMQTKEVHEGHDFYGKETFKEDIEDIWNNLRDIGIFKKKYADIENEELFKYSPWKLFDSNQLSVIKSVKNNIRQDINSFVNGSAGTGKTLIIIRIAMDYILENDDDKIVGIYSAKKGNDKTFSRVINRLGTFYKKRIKVITKLDKNVIDKIDHILIDEAQRLRVWHGFSAPSYFKEYDKGACPNEVEWIEMNNIPYSLFYDIDQAFNNKDLNLIDYINYESQYNLISQYRMKAGDKWTKLVKQMLQIEEMDEEVFDLGDYEFGVFDSSEDLFMKVLEMNKSDGGFDNKSRMLASLSVAKWDTKEDFNRKDKAANLDYTNVRNEFSFGEFKAVWNKQSHYGDWLENSDVSEVGCVHTAQGRDFKYAGILFGDDIDVVNGKIIATTETLRSYFILLTRGIYGHGIYTSNENIKKYINNFISKKITKV